MSYKKFEEYNIKVTKEVKHGYQEIIKTLGEDIHREGLLKTPERAAKAMQFLTSGYHLDADEILKSAMFKESYNDMVIVKDIEIYSLCEHTCTILWKMLILLIFQTAQIVGLSKIHV